MSANELDVFDKTLQITHIWLNEITELVGPDKQVAWHVLGGVLRAVRDRIPLELAVHLGAELPILVRGIYYDQWRPEVQPERYRSEDEFLTRVAENIGPVRPVNPRDAAQAVFSVLSHHVPEGQLGKVRDALPEDVRALWTHDRSSEGQDYDPTLLQPATAQPEQAAKLRT
jgi:uncharacterized protein (DUF2267 family)